MKWQTVQKILDAKKYIVVSVVLALAGGILVVMFNDNSSTKSSVPAPIAVQSTNKQQGGKNVEQGVTASTEGTGSVAADSQASTVTPADASINSTTINKPQVQQATVSSVAPSSAPSIPTPEPAPTPAPTPTPTPSPAPTPAPITLSGLTVLGPISLPPNTTSGTFTIATLDGRVTTWQPQGGVWGQTNFDPSGSTEAYFVIASGTTLYSASSVSFQIRTTAQAVVGHTYWLYLWVNGTIRYDIPVTITG